MQHLQSIAALLAKFKIFLGHEMSNINKNSTHNDIKITIFSQITSLVNSTVQMTTWSTIWLSKLLNTREEYSAWKQRCDEFIESLEEQGCIKCPRSIDNRQSLIACIAQLENLKESVRQRFVHVNTRYGLLWRVIEMAFESHILSDRKL